MGHPCVKEFLGSREQAQIHQVILRVTSCYACQFNVCFFNQQPPAITQKQTARVHGTSFCGHVQKWAEQNRRLNIGLENEETRHENPGSVVDQSVVRRCVSEKDYVQCFHVHSSTKQGGLNLPKNPSCFNILLFSVGFCCCERLFGVRRGVDCLTSLRHHYQNGKGLQGWHLSYRSP